jgi:hypothetical protein
MRKTRFRAAVCCTGDWPEEGGVKVVMDMILLDSVYNVDIFAATVGFRSFPNASDYEVLSVGVEEGNVVRQI